MARAKPNWLRNSTEDLDEEAPPPGPTPDDIEALKKLSLKEMLVEGRLALIRQLLWKVQSHCATAAEAAVLRNLLRDNGLILGIDTEDLTEGTHEYEGGGQIGFQLPDLNDDDED